MESTGALAQKDHLNPTEAAKLRSNWHLLCFAVSSNCACANCTLIYATTLLDKQVGYIGGAVFYLSACLASLFLGPQALSVLGQRLTLVVATSSYASFVGLFALATALPDGSLAQWLIVVPASSLGGLSGGLIWPAQGGYLACSADRLAAAAEGGRQSATSWHAAVFGVYYLICEVTLKLTSSAALSLNVLPWVIFAVYSCLGFVCSWTCCGLLELQFPGLEQATLPLLAAVSLWADPTIWCLAFLNLAFGFTAAFMNGYVAVTYTKPQLGASAVGYLASATACMGAACSYLFGLVAIRTGTKGPILLLGSLCFLSIPLMVLLFGFDGWHLWLLLPYAIMGSGRAVYESTNRGIFADFFPGAKAEGAFANQMMQATLSFAISYIFSATLSRNVLAIIIFVLALATFPGYLLACVIRRHNLEADSVPSKADLEDHVPNSTPESEGLRQRGP